MPIVKEREYRTMALPLAVEETAQQKRFETDFYVEGYAATFGQPYELFEDYEGIKYYEMIDRSALDGADMRDVIMLFDHRGKPYARMSNQTLGIEADSRGLFTFADLSKSESSRQLYQEISAGLITQMSWSFMIREDSYDRLTHTRTIKRIRKVYDVSAVSFPANPETEISARSWVDGVIDAEKREALARRRQLIKIKTYLEV